MIDILDSGLIYRNPKPNLRSVHAWHPTLVVLGTNEMLASFDLASAVEAVDYFTYLSRSADGGRTWSTPVRLFQDPAHPKTIHTVRIAGHSDGSLTAFGTRIQRDDPERGIANPENLGYSPTQLILLRSRDQGRNWEGPEVIEPPLVGPAWETCHAIVELPDGRWLAPTSTWKSWDGAAPNGMKAVALVSHDRGRTWPDYLDIFDGYADGVIHWEKSLVILPDGRLLAVAWAFHEPTGRSLPTPYALYSGTGRSFSAPQPTGLHGQTAKLLSLGDGRVLCLYRRNDRPGLWANLSRIDGDRWENLAETRLWHGAQSGMTGAQAASVELSALKFGYPSPVRLSNGDVLAAFWCVEDCLHVIRWVRLRVA